MNGFIQKSWRVIPNLYSVISGKGCPRPPPQKKKEEKNIYIYVY